MCCPPCCQLTCYGSSFCQACCCTFCNCRPSWQSCCRPFCYLKTLLSALLLSQLLWHTLFQQVYCRLVYCHRTCYQSSCCCLPGCLPEKVLVPVTAKLVCPISALAHLQTALLPPPSFLTSCSRRGCILVGCSIASKFPATTPDVLEPSTSTNLITGLAIPGVNSFPIACWKPACDQQFCTCE